MMKTPAQVIEIARSLACAALLVAALDLTLMGLLA